LLHKIAEGGEKMALSLEEFAEFKEKGFKFIWDELAPLADEIERTERIPRERLWPRFRDHGFLGMLIPKEYGGTDLAETQYLEFEKEWSKVHGGIRVILHVHNGVSDSLLAVGTGEQKRKYLPKIAQGELSCALGLTEPDGGTGRDIKSRAKRDGSNFLLNGRKHLITNADFAEIFNVVCWIEQKPGDFKIGNLLVEKGREGFTLMDMKPCWGCKGAFHGRLNFKDCLVPAGNVLGAGGETLESTLHHLNVSRVRISANALGTMERCLDLAVEFSKKRVTFGKPIAERQAIHGHLSDMATNIYALQCVIADAGKKIDERKDIYLEANLCKLLAIGALRDVTDKALLIFGGIGYTNEYPIGHLYRDGRLNWLEEGTPTIHSMVASRRLLKGYRTYKPYHKEEIEGSADRHIRLAAGGK
jgi:alkylation response protein AidB-like acyl-CoA dehydrogenase